MSKLIKFSTFILLVLSATLFARDSFKMQNDLDGGDIFDSKGCTVCHDVKMERIAPSLQYISTIYQRDENALVSFLKGERSAIVYPENASTMQPQLLKLKSLYDDEIRALARYIIQSD